MMERRPCCLVLMAALTDDRQGVIGCCFMMLVCGCACWAQAGPLADSDKPSLPWLQVKGNQIVDAAGRLVVLRGVNLANWEWTDRSKPDISKERKAIPIAAGRPSQGWGANVITLGMASGPINRKQAAYLQALDELVRLTKEQGAYAHLCYRYEEMNNDQPKMPDQAAEDAMAALAARYKNEPAVIYGLQVEPHPRGRPDAQWATLKPRLTTMIDAIRKKNPRALILVPGTQWGRYIYHALTDPIPRENLVYKSHTYDSWHTIRTVYRLDEVAKEYPVILGEFGGGGSLELSGVEPLIDYCETNGISWIGWLFHYKGCPCMLKGPNGFEPTPYGSIVMRKLQSAAGRKATATAVGRGR